MRNDKILLSHGSGGRMMQELIINLFLKHFNEEKDYLLTDSAILEIEEKYLTFTTDSYVVDPIFFPGGNIGKIAICGTINDLSVSASQPLYISVSFIIEEGFSFTALEEIVCTMSEEAKKAGVKIVTGDTKVVPSGKCDKLFINTSGIGVVYKGYENVATGKFIENGDKIIINGYIGDHAIAILGARENLKFEMSVVSDCCSLNKVIQKLIEEKISIKFMRDITRGGLATIVSEIVEDKNYGIYLDEEKIPISEAVRGVCEVYGFDPIYLANEGKFLMIVKNEHAAKAIEIMKMFEESKNAEIIGEVTEKYPSKVILNTITGGKRLLEALSGEILPRIC